VKSSWISLDGYSFVSCSTRIPDPRGAASPCR
jgi:hypothetical protein